MWSFFKRASKPGRAEMLLVELDKLDPESQDSTARQLALLWSAFVDEFGISQFVQDPSPEHQAYLERLDRIIDKSREKRKSELGVYYYSTALLRLFLEARLTRDTSPTARALSERLVWLIERGRELETDPQQDAGPANLRVPKGPKPQSLGRQRTGVRR